MERGDLAEFGQKNATQMMIFLPIENVGRKIITTGQLRSNTKTHSQEWDQGSKLSKNSLHHKV